MGRNDDHWAGASARGPPSSIERMARASAITLKHGRRAVSESGGEVPNEAKRGQTEQQSSDPNSGLRAPLHDGHVREPSVPRGKSSH